MINVFIKVYEAASEHECIVGKLTFMIIDFILMSVTKPYIIFTNTTFVPVWPNQDCVHLVHN